MFCILKKREINRMMESIDNLQEKIESNNQQVEKLYKINAEIQQRFENIENNINSVNAEIDKINNNVHNRFIILENDRTQLFNRYDELKKVLEDIDSLNVKSRTNMQNQLTILEKDRTEVFARYDELKKVLRDCGFLNVKSRVDSRIIRLEILQYYSDTDRYNLLNQEQKDIIDYLKNDYDYELGTGRTYYEDEYYAKKEEEIICNMKEEDGLWYTCIGNHKVFFGENKHDAEDYYKETLYWLEEDTPHRYVDVEKDGIGIPEDSILLDIGAAEGYFGLKYLDRCKKVYFFECDDKWLKYLQLATEGYEDKVEIIKGFVGDEENHIILDEFFKTREKPTVIKMDIEGAEGAALRGMQNIINDDSLPLTMFICTYHRQDDWNRYYEMLYRHFNISSSNRHYWNMLDPKPPFFRKGIMRAQRRKK